MTQGCAHAIHKDARKGSLHLFRLTACLFTGKAVPAQDKAQNAVPTQEELSIDPAVVSEGNLAIGGMEHEAGGRKLSHRLGDGRGIDMELLGQIHGFYTPSLFEDISQIFTTPGRNFTPGEIYHGIGWVVRVHMFYPVPSFLSAYPSSHQVDLE
jgi:hypothetical protein